MKFERSLSDSARGYSVQGASKARARRALRAAGRRLDPDRRVGVLHVGARRTGAPVGKPAG